MARVLIVVPPLHGHINPTRGVGAELLARGHQVAWVGHPSKVTDLPAGAELFALSEDDPSGVGTGVLEASQDLRGLRSVKFFYEAFLVPLARSMMPGVRDAVARFRPDVMLVDQQAVAGAIVAREAGIPWATSCTTSAGIVEPLEAFPLIAAWREELLAGLQREVGQDPVPALGLSPHAVIVYSTDALVRAELPGHVHLIGPVFTGRPVTPFPWDALLPVPRVLVSLGTVSFARGEAFYRAVAEGLADLPLQVVLVAPDVLADLPANVLRRDHVPQVALLPHVDAVVCHGGHNTVVEALAAGKPLVVAPIRDDQPIVVNQVVAAGAGVRVKFGRARPESLREAVRRVLEDPSFGSAAAAVAASFQASRGARGAAEILEGLISARTGPTSPTG